MAEVVEREYMGEFVRGENLLKEVKDVIRQQRQKRDLEENEQYAHHTHTHTHTHTYTHTHTHDVRLTVELGEVHFFQRLQLSTFQCCKKSETRGCLCSQSIASLW